MGASAMDSEKENAANVPADPTSYADDVRLHAALAHLRANEPVAWVDNPPYRPIWVVTKHADIMAVERDNELFISGLRPLMIPAEGDDAMKQHQAAGIGLRNLIHMDDPRHRDVRKIGADWFQPKAMRDLKVRVSPSPIFPGCSNSLRRCSAATTPNINAVRAPPKICWRC